MYLEHHSDGHFEAATGTLQMESTDGIVEYESIMWLEDTSDGGASHFIREIDGSELKRRTQEAGSSEEVPIDWRPTRFPVAIPGAKDEKRHHPEEHEKPQPVHAHCHCRGVEFWITPPDEDSKNAESPWPDLIIPHHRNKSHNPDNYPWWLPGGKRFLTGTCACASCRRASGFDITFWAFVPTANIFLDAALAQPFPVLGCWGSMATYASSKGVARTFCSTCGANVFWNGDRENFGREGLLDVAVGLLDAPSGARAEELLAWWPGRVSFGEEALNKGLVKGLESGLKDWARRNEGRACVAEYGGNILEGRMTSADKSVSTRSEEEVGLG